MNMTLPLRILQSITPLAESRLTKFENVPVANLSDCLNRLSGVIGLNKYHDTVRLAGTALTVKTRPGDNLMIHKALEMAQDGHVLVVDGGGALDNALVGEIILLYARSKGIRGFVINGAIRDLSSFKKFDFPCYAKGYSHLGPFKDGPGEINIPVVVGGMVIHPGDVIIGDNEGVIAFHPSQIDDLYTCAENRALQENEDQENIKNNTHSKTWVDACLWDKGITFEQ